MKQRICTFVAVTLTASGVCTGGDFALRLHLNNVVPGHGQLLIGVCRETEFLKSNCAFQTVVAATANPQIVTVSKSSLSPGHYGVQVVYDRNSNARLDTNLLGIPKEPVGFSRQARGRMGPPRFEQAAIEYGGEPRELVIHLY